METDERILIYKRLEKLEYVKDSTFDLQKGNYGNYVLSLSEKEGEKILVEQFSFDNSLYIISNEYDSYRQQIYTLDTLEEEVTRLMKVILLRVRTSYEDKYSIL